MRRHKVLISSRTAAATFIGQRISFRKTRLIPRPRCLPFWDLIACASTRLAALGVPSRNGRNFGWEALCVLYCLLYLHIIGIRLVDKFSTLPCYTGKTVAEQRTVVGQRRKVHHSKNLIKGLAVQQMRSPKRGEPESIVPSISVRTWAAYLHVRVLFTFSSRCVTYMQRAKLIRFLGTISSCSGWVALFAWTFC